MVNHYRLGKNFGRFAPKHERFPSINLKFGLKSAPAAGKKHDFWRLKCTVGARKIRFWETKARRRRKKYGFLGAKTRRRRAKNTVFRGKNAP